MIRMDLNKNAEIFTEKDNQKMITKLEPFLQNPWSQFSTGAYDTSKFASEIVSSFSGLDDHMQPRFSHKSGLNMFVSKDACNGAPPQQTECEHPWRVLEQSDPAILETDINCHLSTTHAFAAGDFVLGNRVFWFASGSYHNVFGGFGLDSMIACRIYGSCFQEVGVSPSCATIHLPHDRNKQQNTQILVGMDGSGDLSTLPVCIQDMHGLKGIPEPQVGELHKFGLLDIALDTVTFVLEDNCHP